jgi:hypothetical protein
MDAEIRQLEERVQRAVVRIRELTAERERLADEVRSLKAEAAKARETKRAKPERPEAPVGAWMNTLRESIRELQGA